MSPHYASGQISQTCFLLNTCFSTFSVKILMSLHHEHGQEYHQHIFCDRSFIVAQVYLERLYRSPPSYVVEYTRAENLNFIKKIIYKFTRDGN